MGDWTDEELSNALIGVMVCILASMLSSLGVNLQAYSLASERKLNRFTELLSRSFNSNAISPTIDPPNNQSSFNRLYWYLGFIIYLICQTCGSVIALAFLKPEIVAPLGSTGLIFNIIFSRLFLGSRITKRDCFGTLLILIGCATVSVIGSISSDHNNRRKLIHELVALYTRPLFLAYFLTQISVIIFIMFFIKFSKRDGLLHPTEPIDTVLSEPASYIDQPYSPISRIIPPTTFYIDESRSSQDLEQLPESPLLTRRTSTSRFSEFIKSQTSEITLVNLLGILYAFVGGIAASESLVLVQHSIDILFAIQDEIEYVGFSISVILLLITSVFIQLYSLNCALKYSLPTIVVPMFYTSYTVLEFLNSIVIGGVLGGQFFWLVVFGLVMIVFGVWLLGNKAPEDGF